MGVLDYIRWTISILLGLFTLIIIVNTYGLIVFVQVVAILFFGVAIIGGFNWTFLKLQKLLLKR